MRDPEIRVGTVVRRVAPRALEEEHEQREQ